MAKKIFNLNTTLYPQPNKIPHQTANEILKDLFEVHPEYMNPKLVFELRLIEHSDGSADFRITITDPHAFSFSFEGVLYFIVMTISLAIIIWSYNR